MTSEMTSDEPSNGTSVWDSVVGQGAAVAQLRAALERGPVHAYSFVGPPGSTKTEAARAFATVLLTGSDDPDTRDGRLIMAGEHPDVREIHREGAGINIKQARDIAERASLSPIESDRKVLILHEFHLLEPTEAPGILLKTIEEPPPSTTFVVLADSTPPELMTIWSRSTRVGFRPIPDDIVRDRLVADGVEPSAAERAAASAFGDLDRAHLLATDTGLADRRSLFSDAPRRLDGSGSTVMKLVDDVLGAIEQAAAPLTERHESELADLEERVSQLGERGSGRKDMEARHRRELRRHRTDELKAGLSALAVSYRDELVERPSASSAETVHRIHQAMAALDQSVNEALLLQSLFWSLPPAH